MQTIEKNQILNEQELAQAKIFIETGNIEGFYDFLGQEKGFNCANLQKTIVTDTGPLGNAANRYMSNVIGDSYVTNKPELDLAVATKLYELLEQRSQAGISGEITWDDAKLINQQALSEAGYSKDAWFLSTVEDVISNVTFHYESGSLTLDINDIWRKALSAQAGEDKGQAFLKELSLVMGFISKLTSIDAGIQEEASNWFDNIANVKGDYWRTLTGNSNLINLLDNSLSSDQKSHLIATYVADYQGYLNGSSTTPYSIISGYLGALNKFTTSGKLFDPTSFSSFYLHYRTSINNPEITLDLNNLNFEKIDASGVTSSGVLNGLNVTVVAGTDDLLKLNVNNYDVAYVKNAHEFVGSNSGDKLDFTDYKLNVNIDGGKGNDTLKGGKGNDTLKGGEGGDTLEGGEGFDSYIAGDQDVITDSDGKGRVFFEGNSSFMSGGFQDAQDKNKFIDNKGNTYTLSGRDLIIKVASNKSFTIKNFVPADFKLEEGKTYSFLGITLVSKKHEENNGLQTENIQREKLEVDDKGSPLYASDGGNYHLVGKSSNDHIYGGSGSDSMEGMAGVDILDGGDGNDIILGGNDIDGLFGGKGNDTLIGGGARNEINGGDGNDIIFADQATKVNADWGNINEPVVEPTKGSFLTGGEGNDTMVGSNQSDIIFSGTGSDVIYAGEGNDLIHLNNDAYKTKNPTAGGNLAEWDWDVKAVEVNGVTVYKYVNMYYSYVVDSSDTPKIAYAGSGNDTILGSNGLDFIYAGLGKDLVFGGSGNGLIDGGAGDDTLYGDVFWEQKTDYDENYYKAKEDDHYGDDTIDGGSGNDIIWGNGGNDYLLGGDGKDTIYGDTNEKGLDNKHFGNDYIDAGSGNDQVLGGYGDDTILGGEGNDSLYGDFYDDNKNISLHGNDYIDGGDGDDIIHGGGGDDTLLGGKGKDNLAGGTGNNKLYGGAGDDYLRAVGRDMPGEHGDNYLDGGEDNDRLEGGAGADTLIGGTGNDILLGRYDVGSASLDRDNDSLDGGDGNDLLIGYEGNNTLMGGKDNDCLVSDLDARYELTETGPGMWAYQWKYYDIGIIANDYLDGGEGDDTLVSAGGDDTLYGGGGSDTYQITLKANNTVRLAEEDKKNDKNIDTVVVKNVSFNLYEDNVKITRVGNQLTIKTLDGTIILDDYTKFEVLRFTNTDIKVADLSFNQQGQATIENHTPVVTGTMDDITIKAENLFSTDIPENLFTDEDAKIGDKLTYSVSLSDGSSLPDWLVFDPETLTFSGTAPEDIAELQLIITATDKKGLSASKDVTLKIIESEIEGTGEDDNIFALDEINHIYGGAGNDEIAGVGTIQGGTGNDSIMIIDDVAEHLLTKSNTLIFDLGDGIDTLTISRTLFNTKDIIKFGEGISPDSISFTVLDDYGESIVMRYGDQGDMLVFDVDSDDYLMSLQNSLTVQFADGTVWSNLGDYIKVVVNGTDDSDDLYASSYFNSTVLGGAGDDYIYGETGGTHYLDGGEDNDEISGHGTLIGGKGNDTIYAYEDESGNGEDTVNVIIFNVGDGQDELNNDNASGRDAIRFGNGITADMLAFEYDASSESLLIKIGTDGDQILLANATSQHSNALNQRVEFADGTVWNNITEHVIVTQTGTDGDNMITGTKFLDYIYGLAGNDTIRVEQGLGYIDGGADDDYIIGQGTLIGGKGNDTIEFPYTENLAPDYASTIVFNIGDGQDSIRSIEGSAYPEFNHDTPKTIIQFGEGITADTISFEYDLSEDSEDPYSLIIKIGNTGDQITLENYLGQNMTNGDLYNLKFADGSVLNLKELIGPITQYGTDDDDSFYGTSLDNIIYGGKGNDNIMTTCGVNYLDGGEGDDYITGGAGTYVGGKGNDEISIDSYSAHLLNGSFDTNILFNLGDGQDTIFDNSANSDPETGEESKIQGTQTYKFGEGITTDMISFTRDENDSLIIMIGDQGDQITLADYYSEYQMGPTNYRFEFADGTVWECAGKLGIDPLTKTSPSSVSDSSQSAGLENQTNNLIDAIASFAPQGSANSLAQDKPLELNNVLLAANI